MHSGVCHHDKLLRLKKIEGQIRGVQRMIDDERYCVDILHAVGAAIGALQGVETSILKDHLDACAKTAFMGKSEREKKKKLDEIFGLIGNLRK